MLVQAREFLTIYLLISLELPLFCPNVGWFLTGLWNEITVQMGCQWLPEVFGMENECLLHFDYRTFCEKTHCLGECGICLPLNSLWIKYRTYVEMACLSSSCHAPFCTFDASCTVYTPSQNWQIEHAEQSCINHGMCKHHANMAIQCTSMEIAPGCVGGSNTLGAYSPSRGVACFWFCLFSIQGSPLISPISSDRSHQAIITWPLGAVFFDVSDVSLTFPVKRKETC